MPPDYLDDAALPGDAVLWRSINPRHIKDDALNVSSAAYSTDGLSVYVVAETTAAALAVKFPGWPFQCFTAQVARDAGCIICAIADDDGDTSHREVRRASDPEGQLRSEAKRILKAAKWVYHDDVPTPQPPEPLPPM
jgi:hypothetical protein